MYFRASVGVAHFESFFHIVCFFSSKCIYPNWQMYLLKLTKVFVEIGKCICWNGQKYSHLSKCWSSQRFPSVPSWGISSKHFAFCTFGSAGSNGNILLRSINVSINGERRMENGEIIPEKMSFLNTKSLYFLLLNLFKLLVGDYYVI